MGEIGILVDRERGQLTLNGGEHQRDGLGDETGAAAGAVHRGAADLAGRLHLRTDVGIHRRQVMECAAGGDDVDARREQRAQLAGVE